MSDEEALSYLKTVDGICNQWMQQYHSKLTEGEEVSPLEQAFKELIDAFKLSTALYIREKYSQQEEQLEEETNTDDNTD